MEPAIIVHGGAGHVADWQIPLLVDGGKKAAIVGYEVLSNHGSVLDAVEAAVKVMEDDAAFMAGNGKQLTRTKHAEMDAIIMEGETLKIGAVASIKNVNNPIEVARLVMETTPHVLLAGASATNFAKTCGVHHVNDADIITDFTGQSLDNFLRSRRREPTSNAEERLLGAVGAVAIDSSGRVACATSTGMTGKTPGRVSDTPLAGAGGYCDDMIGGCSATGQDEAIARVCLCRHITGLMDGGMEPKEATEKALNYMQKRTGKTGGAITISNKGDIGLHFTSESMPWAYVKNDEVHYGINMNDEYVDHIDHLALKK